MKLLSIGYNHLHDKNFTVDRPNGIDTWLFLLIKTPALFKIDGQIMKTEATSFVLFQEGFPHWYSANKQEYIDDWFHFLVTEDDIDFFRSINFPLNQVTSLGDIETITTVIRAMTYEFYSNNSYKAEIINENFKLLFYKISQVLHNNSLSCNTMDSVHFLHMQALRNDIYNNPQIDRNVDLMASLLSLSRSAFQHNYKKIFGKSVMSDIINSRLIKVKYYLTTTNLTLEEISQRCGYHSQLHLIRQFKQNYGITPTEFRKCR